MVAAVGLWLIAVMPAYAADTQDQNQPFFTGTNTLRNPMAQTFTPGGDGGVDRVSLMMNTAGGATSITVQIQTVSGGKPSGTVLGSTVFAGSVACCHLWKDFTFSPAVPVTSGTQYAIVARPNANFSWYADFGHDDYPAGQLFLASGSSWLTGGSFGYDFTFRTYLTGAVTTTNHAPVVAAANTVVTANEGSAGSNSGTYSDPDGDTVNLTASVGSLTHTGTSSGTWSWSMPAADESPTASITVTADDGHGATATVTFTYTVLAVAPTVKIAAAPSSSPEGTALTLTGSATSPSADDNTAGLLLTWSVTKDGAPFATGGGASFSFTPDDEGSFVATLTATDDGSATASASVTIAGANVAPSVAISGVTHSTLVLVPNQPVTFDGGFTDPGKLDTHHVTLDFGDGTPADTYDYAAGGTGDTTDDHPYAAAGTYTITYSVADDDGGASSVSVKVTVESPAQALSIIDGYVGSMSSLNAGEKNGLSAKLEAAMASAARGNDNATCNQLDAFLNDLDALTKTGRLSASDSAALAQATWSVHRALGCTRIKVGWASLSL